MKPGSVKIITICPWALREAILLRHLEDGADWWTDLNRHDVAATASAQRGSASCICA